MAVFTFDGLGIVQTRELPSGDLAVWHPLSEGLRAVVEPICRGRGHWKAEFKNWIVFKGFAHVVLADLGRHGKEIG